MQLTPMRFTMIEGTEVTVKVNSPSEAKTAIKELRHRKKEVGCTGVRCCAGRSLR